MGWGVKEYVMNTLSRADAEQFALWAFGPGYERKDRGQLMRTWNRLHGDWLNVRPTDEIPYSLTEMIKAWRVHVSGFC